MNNLNFKKRFEKLEQRVARNKAAGKIEKIRVEGKICPFMSDANAEVACLEQCALYRSGKKKDYECVITELGPLSWSLRAPNLK